MRARTSAPRRKSVMPSRYRSFSGFCSSNALGDQRDGQPMHRALGDAEPLGQRADADLDLFFGERIEQPDGRRDGGQPRRSASFEADSRFDVPSRSDPSHASAGAVKLRRAASGVYARRAPSAWRRHIRRRSKPPASARAAAAPSSVCAISASPAVPAFSRRPVIITRFSEQTSAISAAASAFAGRSTP